MKVKYYVFLVNLLIVSYAFPQNASDLVAEINNTYTAVNDQLDSYDKYNVDIQKQSLVYHQLVVYLLHGQIEKALIYSQSHQGNVITELYFKEGILVLLADKKLPDNTNINNLEVEPEALKGEYFYLHEGKLIKYVSSDKKERWNSSIPDKENKEKYISSTEDKVMMFFNSRLLADIPMYSDRTIEYLLNEKPEIHDAINELTESNDDIIRPLLATKAVINEEEDNVFSALGEISWGEKNNSTYLVFDLLNNKIYIWNRLEGENSVYCSDNNFPKVFSDWVNSFQ